MVRLTATSFPAGDGMASQKEICGSMSPPFMQESVQDFARSTVQCSTEPVVLASAVLFHCGGRVLECHCGFRWLNRLPLRRIVRCATHIMARDEVFCFA
jgi:hypothetical protein